MIVSVLTFLGSLGMFLFGMRVMSEALQKLSGKRLRAMMQAMTSNRLAGIGTGFLVTCLVQSSSASTVMVVGFVNAGLLTLRESIGVILGANLGTTSTFWIVSFLGFKFSISSVALPVIGVGFPLLFFKRAPARYTGEFLIGFGLLFLGLLMLKDSVPNIQDNPEALAFIESFTGRGLMSVLFFFVFGSLLTVAVQSSSIAGAITLTMAYKGWIDYPSAAAIILGENVGTTITANLAAIAGNTSARRAAFAHFLFNIMGVCWAIAMFNPLIRVVDAVIPSDSSLPHNLPMHMAAFHTLFNLINITLMVGFVPQLARLAERVVRDRTRIAVGHVTFSTATLPETAELNLAEAEREVGVLGGHARELLEGFLNLFEAPGMDSEDRATRFKTVEDASDRTAFSITDYLLKCSARGLSEESLLRVSSLLRVTAELEDICDSGYRLVQLAARKSRKNRQLPPETMQEVRGFSELLFQFMDFWSDCLSRSVTASDMEAGINLENQIDAARKRLRKESVRRMQLQGEAIKAEMLYIDILNNMERIGNNSVNILQALRHTV